MGNPRIYVFTLWKDDVTGKREGAHERMDTSINNSLHKRKEDSGIYYAPLSNSPKISEHQVFVCAGEKAIKEGFERYNLWVGNF